jgi:hypothetical protein
LKLSMLMVAVRSDDVNANKKDENIGKIETV